LIRKVAETGSTNSDLIALARLGEAEGIWLRAERQSGGRGRHGRVWQSPPGNLHASTLVRLRAADPPAPSLALVAAIAIHEAVSSFVPEVRIKWPNDLVVRGAKLAGILLEREGEAVIAGFGVNLAAAPEGLERPTTSLTDELGEAPDPDHFLDRLVQSFSSQLEAWRRLGLERLRSDWLERAHPVGTPLSTAEGEGLFDGLEEDGALRLRLADGTCRVIHAGDIFFL
jgi:BirA family biotin operon repressor/biotin-[acetyl-CoA-carboxylase] ligase